MKFYDFLNKGAGTKGKGTRITSVTGTILKLLQLPIPAKIQEPAEDVLAFAEEQKPDRVVIYNPDAVALWIYEKYKTMFSDAEALSDLTVGRASVMPSVTPVCFASMYTGLLPKYHGIRVYTKPVLRCKTLFDYMLDAGKKCCIVSSTGDSISKIFLERKMDYFIYDTVEEVNKKALEVLDEDYDLVVIYNGNYDGTMHKNGPEAEVSLEALRQNLAFYCEIVNKIKSQNRKTFYGFCPDHGCHQIDHGCGSHGLDTDEDMNVVHMYGISK